MINPRNEKARYGVYCGARICLNKSERAVYALADEVLLVVAHIRFDCAVDNVARVNKAVDCINNEKSDACERAFVEQEV